MSIGFIRRQRAISYLCVVFQGSHSLTLFCQVQFNLEEICAESERTLNLRKASRVFYPLIRSQPNENPHYKAGRTSKRWIAAFCIATMAAICILVTVVVRERKSAFDRESIEAANLSAALDEQIR